MLFEESAGLRARRRMVRCLAWPTASAWKWVAAMDTTSFLMRSTRYSAATLSSRQHKPEREGEPG